MSEQEGTKTLTFDRLSDLREKTEVIAQHLRGQLQTYLDTLRPLFAPRRLLGKYVGVRDDVPGADKALAQLQERYQEVCRQPFGLPTEFNREILTDLDNRIELFAWEYTHEAHADRETKTVTLHSPVRWVLAYSSSYSLSQLRQTVSGLQERRADYIQQFIVNALVLQLLFERYPGIPKLLTDLRYQVEIRKAPGLGEVPLVTVSSCLPSFRPDDDLIIKAIRFSGVPAFIELIDSDAIGNLRDPLKGRLEEIIR